MTGHTAQRSGASTTGTPPRAVAIAYRARRQEGVRDGSAYEAAVAELHGRAPDLTDQTARDAVSLIIAWAATEGQAWFWRGTNHGWPPPWQAR